MYLKKLDKEFPQDFDVIRKSDEEYIIGPGLRKRYEYYVDNGQGKKKGYSHQYPALEHHPVYRLIKELIKYDLTDRAERIEFLSVVTVALLIDDYKLIKDLLYTVNSSIKELNNMENIKEFIEELEKAEEAREEVE